MAKITITRVGVGSLAKLVGVWQAVIGLIVGIIAAVAGSVSVITNNNYSTGTDILASIGIVIAAIVIYPLIMFVVGWLQGAIIGIIFNFIISGSGGLEIDTLETKK